MIYTTPASPNEFLLRKQIFDFLKNSLVGVADVFPENPVAGGSGGSKPKVVVSLLNADTTAGRYNTTMIINPDIKICMYADTDLVLTKPTGLIRTVMIKMGEFLTNKSGTHVSNFHLVRSYPCDYDAKIMLYEATLIYRFYLGNKND
jgi:hypothetical protein